MRTNRVARGIMLGLAGFALVVGGCATTTGVSPQAVSELLELRNGLLDGKAQIQKTIGTTNISGAPGSGKARIQNSTLAFDGCVTRGTATLHEGDGRRVLKGQGTWVGFPGNAEIELTKR